MNDFFKEIKIREKSRMENAVKRAREVVLRDHFPYLHDYTLKEIRDYEELLERLEGLILLGIQGFYKHLPSPLEEVRGRSKWEVYLSGLRYLIRKYPQGFFRTILALKEWEGFPEKIDAYLEKSVSALSDFYLLAREIRKYCLNYNKGRKIARQYIQIQDDKEPEENEENCLVEEDFKNLCRLYASLKSWEQEEEFSRFNNHIEKCQNQFFEVIIEGPIQLYLLIGEETWFFILKILTIEHLGDFFLEKDKKELHDLREINKLIYKTIENSEFYQTLKSFIREFLKIYVDDLKRSQERLRGQYPTRELKRKFVKRFERGEIFRKNF